MRISLYVAILIALFAMPIRGWAAGDMPLISSVEPQSARPGDSVTAQGSSLGPESVSALYLTDGTNDTKVEILAQTSTSLKFRVPTSISPGRLSLMVLTNAKEPRLLEEPVKLTVEPNTTGRH